MIQTVNARRSLFDGAMVGEKKHGTYGSYETNGTHSYESHTSHESHRSQI